MIQTSLIDSMGNDLSVVNAARVSFGKRSEWEQTENTSSVFYVEQGGGTTYLKLSDRDTKLIHYLAKHKHLSPFGHAFASFHVKCPLFVHAQLVKHKFLRVNTISRRYVDDNIEFYVPDVWRGRSADKKQGSEGVVEDYNTTALPLWHDDALRYYNMLLESGVAPEMARMILPQSLMTEFIWSGSLDAFAAMCRLRCASDTQYESRIVADQISAKMSELFPVSWDALMTDWGVVVSDGRRATEDDVPPWEYKELEAKLAKAVDAIDGLLAVLPDDEGPEIDYARTTIAEMKGEK